MTPSDKNFKNILIIKPSSLGDITMALPALAALHRNFTDAKISWLIRPQFAQLVENHPHLNNVILFDRKFLGKWWYHPRAFGSLFSLIKRLRQSNFDTVVDLQGLFRTAVLGWLAGCKNRFGMANAREFAHIFYTHKVQQDTDCIHVVDYYLKIIQAAGAADINAHFTLPQDQNAADTINNLLKTRNIDPDNYAVLIPGSVHKYKCWPVENFAKLAEKITSQFGLSIIAVGTDSEKTLIEKLKQLSNVPIANLAGATNLNELTALLRTAKLVVSNDTGPGHIAAALNTPLVMMFGRSNPIRIFPYGRKHCIAAIESDGRGLKLNSPDPKHDINALTVDYVYEKVCEQIKKSNT